MRLQPSYRRSRSAVAYFFHPELFDLTCDRELQETQRFSFFVNRMVPVPRGGHGLFEQAVEYFWICRSSRRTIRKAYGTNIERNACHGSEAPETAAVEIAFFFSNSELAAVQR